MVVLRMQNDHAIFALLDAVNFFLVGKFHWHNVCVIINSQPLFSVRFCAAFDASVCVCARSLAKYLNGSA